MYTKPISFCKLSGSGNDFISIDNRDGRFDALLETPAAVSRFAQTLCQRGHGVGADGVLFASQPEIPGFADISARFFEADGSESELCGNGTACFTHWVIASGFLPDKQIQILTPAGVILGQHVPDAPGYVRVCIPSPHDCRRNLNVTAHGKTFACDFCIAGVPHLMTYVEDINKVNVDYWGHALRHHHDFQPRGVNVNFVQVLNEGHIAIRTFEFGVEAETLACGTGSTSAAAMTALRYGWNGEIRTGKKPVRVLARGGDELRIYFTIHDDESIADPCLETVVRETCHGTLSDDYLAEALGGFRLP